jgi:hypothetical protein
MSRDYTTLLPVSGRANRLGAAGRRAGTEQPGEWEMRAGAAVNSTLPLDFRGSLPFLRKRLYIRLLIGWERRDARRLDAEGQRHPVRLAIGYAILLAFALSALLGLAIVLYCVKSALGIDLLPGPSLFHRAYEVLYCR